MHRLKIGQIIWLGTGTDELIVEVEQIKPFLMTRHIHTIKGKIYNKGAYKAWTSRERYKILNKQTNPEYFL